MKGWQGVLLGTLMLVVSLSNAQTAEIPLTGASAPTTGATVPATVVEDAKGNSFKDILNYYYDREEKDAKFIMQEAPGKNERAIDNGNKLSSAETAFFATTEELLKQGIDRGLGSEQRLDFVEGNPNLRLNGLLATPQLDEKTQAMATAAIDALVEPAPSGEFNRLAQPDQLIIPANRAKLAQELAKQAQLSASRLPLAHMVAVRSPGSKTLPSEYTGAPTKVPTDSFMKTIENEAYRRFQNKDWYGEVAKSSGPALLRELAHMQAFHVKMLLEQYKQMERVELLLSALVANQANTNQGLSQIMSTVNRDVLEGLNR